MKIIVTGGHHTSAFAVIDKLVEHDSSIEIFWFGHKHSMRGDVNVSAEYKDVNLRGIKFYDIQAGKFYKVHSLGELVKIFKGFVNSFKLLRSLKPDGILSFGGYISVPVVVAGFFLGIPSVTHEQTVVVGLANKVISHFVKRIFVSWNKSLSYFPKNKTLLTGIPLRQEIFQAKSQRFSFKDDLPIVYITGGKQGSHRINENVMPVLRQILGFANVIHQCGSTSLYNDFVTLERLKEAFPEELRHRYYVVEYIGSEFIGEAYSKAVMVVTRAGANTVSELTALKKPALLIPISWVSHNEQYENAKMMEDSGLGRILHEETLSPALLVREIKQMLDGINSYKLKDSFSYVPSLESAKVIADETIRIFSQKS